MCEWSELIQDTRLGAACSSEKGDQANLLSEAKLVKTPTEHSVIGPRLDA